MIGLKLLTHYNILTYYDVFHAFMAYCISLNRT